MMWIYWPIAFLLIFTYVLVLVYHTACQYSIRTTRTTLQEQFVDVLLDETKGSLTASDANPY